MNKPINHKNEGGILPIKIRGQQAENNGIFKRAKKIGEYLPAHFCIKIKIFNMMPAPDARRATTFKNMPGFKTSCLYGMVFKKLDGHKGYFTALLYVFRV